MDLPTPRGLVQEFLTSHDAEEHTIRLRNRKKRMTSRSDYSTDSIKSPSQKRRRKENAGSPLPQQLVSLI